MGRSLCFFYPDPTSKMAASLIEQKFRLLDEPFWSMLNTPMRQLLSSQCLGNVKNPMMQLLITPCPGNCQYPMSQLLRPGLYD